MEKYDNIYKKRTTPLWHYETHQFSMKVYLLGPARPVKHKLCFGYELTSTVSA
jgi:hypothetical protein